MLMEFGHVVVSTGNLRINLQVSSKLNEKFKLHKLNLISLQQTIEINCHHMHGIPEK